MKKVLNVISWILFFIAVSAGVVASISAVGGILTLIITLFNIDFAAVFSYFAITFFVALTVLLIIYALACAYITIKEAVSKE